MTEITSARGETVPDGDGGVRLVFHREYPDPIEDIWSAVTEPERLERWIGTFTGQGRVGGTVEFRMLAEGDGTATEEVTILACEPPRHLMVAWTVPDQPQQWRIEVTLQELPTGTALEFVHHLGDPAGAGEMGAGWQYYLDRLDASLVGAEMPEFDPYLALAGHYRQDSA